MKKYYADVTYSIMANSEQEAREKLFKHLKGIDVDYNNIAEGEMDYIDTDMNPDQWNIEEDDEYEELINDGVV